MRLWDISTATLKRSDQVGSCFMLDYNSVWKDVSVQLYRIEMANKQNKFMGTGFKFHIEWKNARYGLIHAPIYKFDRYRNGTKITHYINGQSGKYYYDESMDSRPISDHLESLGESVISATEELGTKISNFFRGFRSESEEPLNKSSQ
eukprot:TRINITY_DN5697_c0_g1_i1.p1 TRINITY_DN5697_c0_g1~~TRINITY_DN5697_c0_g1_i1.p1  ORF type:complete len:148 (-),score=19.40 TRINITY_DN5697_c0_g1_i1:93-536(-)